VRGVTARLTLSPSSIERRRTNLDEGEPVAKKDEEDVDDQDDGAEDAPPESILRHFPRRGPPSAAELRAFTKKFPAFYKTFAPLIFRKIGRDDIGPESRKHVHQDVFTRFWALVKEYGVPPELGEALSAVAWGMLKNYRRRRARAAAHARASRAEPTEASRPAEPSAYFSLLLKEVVDQLPAADWEMLHWVEVEGTPGAVLAGRLGVPEGTVSSRLRAARARVAAILNELSKKAPAK
jgi:DNA-directed RNA polymerase specialized sigma24 family protein